MSAVSCLTTPHWLCGQDMPGLHMSLCMIECVFVYTVYVYVDVLCVCVCVRVFVSVFLSDGKVAIVTVVPLRC